MKSGDALILSDAAERLRKKPGRPPLSEEERERRRLARRAAIAAGVEPRLLDVHSAARYASLSVWTMRDLIASHAVPRVVIPSPSGKNDLRVVRVDREDLDRLIVAWKER